MFDPWFHQHHNWYHLELSKLFALLFDIQSLYQANQGWLLVYLIHGNGMGLHKLQLTNSKHSNRTYRANMNEVWYISCMAYSIEYLSVVNCRLSFELTYSVVNVGQLVQHIVILTTINTVIAATIGIGSLVLY